MAVIRLKGEMTVWLVKERSITQRIPVPAAIPIIVSQGVPVSRAAGIRSRMTTASITPAAPPSITARVRCPGGLVRITIRQPKVVASPASRLGNKGYIISLVLSGYNLCRFFHFMPGLFWIERGVKNL